jgi:hypothetical protein
MYGIAQGDHKEFSRKYGIAQGDHKKMYLTVLVRAGGARNGMSN